MAAKNIVRLLLRRYTSLAATIHFLTRRQITLLESAIWENKVDVDYMKQCGEWLERPVADTA